MVELRLMYSSRLLSLFAIVLLRFSQSKWKGNSEVVGKTNCLTCLTWIRYSKKTHNVFICYLCQSVPSHLSSSLPSVVVSSLCGFFYFSRLIMRGFIPTKDNYSRLRKYAKYREVPNYLLTVCRLKEAAHL